MNRRALEEYRDALLIRLKHRRGTGRETGADMGDLLLLLDALLAEPERVIERATPAADAQWARDRRTAAWQDAAEARQVERMLGVPVVPSWPARGFGPWGRWVDPLANWSA